MRDIGRQCREPFWAWVFCDPDGTPSFARVGTAVVASFVCVWVSALVKWNRALPELAGPAAFMTVLYGINQVAARFPGAK